MACKVTYNGKEYSQEEFMALLYNGELQKLANEGKLNLGRLPSVFLKQPNPALANVEATTKALEGVDALNEFIKNPKSFINKFGIGKDSVLGGAKSWGLSLSIAKSKSDMISNWNEIHDNLKAKIDDIDVSKELKELVYPSDVKDLVQDTDSFLSKLTKRVKQRANKASLQKDFSNPYGRISVTGLTPLKVVNDFENNYDTKFSLSQYEFAKAELDLQLIEFLKGGEFSVFTSEILGDENIKSELLNTFNQDISGEKLIEIVDIKSIKKYVNKIFNKNAKNISEAYHKAKADGSNPELVKAVEDLLFTPQDKLAQAEKELKDAWDNYQNLAAIFDPVESAKKDLALIKAIVNYAIQKGLKTIDEITEMVKQSLPNAKQLKEDVVKRIEMASEIASGNKKYSDVLLEKYVGANLITQSSIGAMQKIASDNSENGILDIDKAMEAVDKLRVPKVIKEACREYLNEVKAEEQAPQQEPVAEPKKKVKQEVLDKIFDVLTKRISSVNMPDFITADLNGTAKQQTSITTGEIEGREIPNEYVQVTLKNLQEVAESDSASFFQEFGEDWIDIVLQAIEMSGSNGRGYPNYARVIGVLNAMSTQINQSIATNTTKEGKDKLDNLQARVDAQANIFARESSLGLRMRQILRVFAEGSSIAQILANKIISSSIVEAKSDVEKAVKKRYTDAELNSAGRPVKPKSQTTTTPPKQTSNKNDVLDKIKATQEVREKTNGKMSLEDRVKELKDKLRNIKC